MNIKDKRPPTSISYTHIQSVTCNSNDKDKRSPAYKGAKFDARGFCIYHEDVRMCRVISDGKFNIVRKVCYRCGSSSLARDKKKTKKLHAQKKKKPPHSQEVSSQLVSTSTRTRDRDDGRVNTNEVQRPNHRQTQQNTIQCRRERRRKTVTDTHTTSPVQKNAPVLPRRPLSSSEVIKPKLITAEKIDELRNMMPPPLYQARSNEDAPKKKETQLPFDKHGCCRLHPTRKIAEKNQDGQGWTIVAGVCPDCCVNAVLQLDLASKQEQSLIPSKKSNLKKSAGSGSKEELIGKIVRVSSDESQHTYPTANSSISVASYYSGSNLSSPDSVTKPSLAFFTTTQKFAGLKISQEDKEIVKFNTSGLSEATHKFKNKIPDPPALPLYQG